MFRLSLVVVFLYLDFCIYAHAQETVPPMTLTVVTDHPDAIYASGEQATFLITAHCGERLVTTGEFTYNLTLDGGKWLGNGTGQLTLEPATVTATLTEPGILRCEVTFNDAPQACSSLAAAAFAPYEIQPAAPEPDDFMAWWEEQKTLLRAIPPDPQLLLSETASNDRATYYKLTLANVEGKRIHGWIGIPKRSGKFPAVLQVPAAGWYGISHDWANLAEQGFLAMGIIIHDFDVETTIEQAKVYEQGPLANYMYQGRDSRATYYFRTAFLACVRALDYLCTRSEWDGINLLVNGSSQGGGLSLVCAGLDDRVTAIAANVPALCDHLGFLAGRTSGWPHLVPSFDAPSATVAPYFDVINFARHARCESLVCVGLVDLTCPPSGVYAAFNQLPAPKRLVVTPLQGHVYSTEYSVAREELIARYAPPAP